MLRVRSPLVSPAEADSLPGSPGRATIIIVRPGGGGGGREYGGRELGMVQMGGGGMGWDGPTPAPQGIPLRTSSLSRVLPPLAGDPADYPPHWDAHAEDSGRAHLYSWPVALSGAQGPDGGQTVLGVPGGVVLGRPVPSPPLGQQYPQQSRDRDPSLRQTGRRSSAEATRLQH